MAALRSPPGGTSTRAKLDRTGSPPSRVISTALTTWLPRSNPTTLLFLRNTKTPPGLHPVRAGCVAGDKLSALRHHNVSPFDLVLDWGLGHRRFQFAKPLSDRIWEWRKAAPLRLKAGKFFPIPRPIWLSAVLVPDSPLVPRPRPMLACAAFAGGPEKGRGATALRATAGFAVRGRAPQRGLRHRSSGAAGKETARWFRRIRFESRPQRDRATSPHLLLAP